MMGCDGPAPGHPDTGEMPIALGGRQMDRCPMALLRDEWTQGVVALHRARDKGMMGARCPSPSAKTLAALDALDVFDGMQRKVEAESADGGRVRVTGPPPWEVV